MLNVIRSVPFASAWVLSAVTALSCVVLASAVKVTEGAGLAEPTANLAETITLLAVVVVT